MYHNFSAQVYARLDGCAFGPKLGWLVHFFFFFNNSSVISWHIQCQYPTNNNVNILIQYAMQIQ